MSKTILIMAGGTGGHLFPGIAVARELQRRNWQIHWLGTASRMEAQLIPKAGFPISFIDVVGVRGNGLLRKLQAPFQIVRSVFQALAVIKRIQPDVILGMGGFASGPGGIAGWLRGVPLILHEQNALPGLTNKWLSRVAEKVLTGFDRVFADQCKKPEKFQWVGNPVREEFFAITPTKSAILPLKLLIVGGSLGAKALNQQVPQALAGLQQIEVRHQCGKGHKQQVVEHYQRLIGEQLHWSVEEFVEDMAAAYQWADLVICRAGALTVAEVAMAGKAAIFVPLPYAVDDHQTRNAEALTTQNAGYLLPQAELQQGKLADLLTDILQDVSQLITKGAAAKALAKPDATRTVADVCEQQAEQYS